MEDTRGQKVAGDVLYLPYWVWIFRIIGHYVVILLLLGGGIVALWFLGLPKIVKDVVQKTSLDFNAFLIRNPNDQFFMFDAKGILFSSFLTR